MEENKSMERREELTPDSTAAETISGGQKNGEGVASLYEWVEAAIFSLVCVVLVFSFLFRIVGVDGESMMRTLMHQDRLILEDFMYTPQRGDIVVVNRYTVEPIVKRIIAVGGDTIEIDPETYEVILNGEVLDEPYLNVKTPPREMDGPVTVPEGHVFVMGDNRGNSQDSRYNVEGLRFIDERDIMGKAVYRIWPFDSIGGLYQ